MLQKKLKEQSPSEHETNDQIKTPRGEVFKGKWIYGAAAKGVKFAII